MARNNEDAMYCYLISYRHTNGAGHCEIQRDQPWHPNTSGSIAAGIAKEYGHSSVAIINVFYQGCYSSEALANLKRLAEVEQAKPNLSIVKE